jgi:hypothetical protein
VQRIRVTCPYCKSSGYIIPPPPQTILMGPCPVCGEAVALYNTRVIGLKDKLLGEGISGEKIQSLARVIFEHINSQSDPISEEYLEQIIRNAEELTGEEGIFNESGYDVSPSIRNPNASQITTEEMEDFLKIDLNLLGKKEFFDRHFG